MKPFLPFLSIAVISFAGMAFAGEHKNHFYSGGHNFSTSTNNADSDACADHMNIWSDDLSGRATGEEEKVVPKQPLKITGSHNGGIHVKQWDRNEIGIKVCKAAVATTDAEAQNVLKSIALSVSGNEVTVKGPDNDDDSRWSSIILVRVPSGAQLDLNAYNGGISFRRVNVNATAETVNGGISLDQASGKLNLEAQNGGVSVKDCNGDIKVRVQNGGVSLKLGPTWNGAGLEARTHNGGLSVEVPRDFRSSLEVEGGRHTAMVCKGDVCERGERTWNNDSDRILRIGSGNPVIRTSTVNGGVVIKNRGSADDDTI
jgi:DUF4097 and DUF4098 domain-containing protein YvlB